MNDICPACHGTGEVPDSLDNHVYSPFGMAPCRVCMRAAAARRLTPAEYRRMPWRNGGGTTTEIAIAPQGASVSGERFLYRVSIADVASDGPFSRFEGYDRHIMLLAGAGMTLDCGVEGRIELRAPFEPRAFSGDWDVHGVLVDGAIRDFNVIVDRSRATATLEGRVVERAETIACEVGVTCMVHVLEGDISGAHQNDTLIGNAPFELVPRGVARVAIVRIAAIASTARGAPGGSCT